MYMTGPMFWRFPVDKRGPLIVHKLPYTGAICTFRSILDEIGINRVFWCWSSGPYATVRNLMNKISDFSTLFRPYDFCISAFISIIASFFFFGNWIKAEKGFSRILEHVFLSRHVCFIKQFTNICFPLYWIKSQWNCYK